MGKVSLLDVTATQGPSDPNAANPTGQGMGQGTGDPATMGGKFAILTNPDQVSCDIFARCVFVSLERYVISHVGRPKTDSIALHDFKVLKPCKEGENVKTYNLSSCRAHFQAPLHMSSLENEQL